jgi:methionyl-tRNA synthetase
MQNPKRYTVTAALPYANGPVHIGHLAGCYLPADIYVRYLKKNQRDVKFICGTDEHGAAINIKAQKEGITPQEVVDKFHGIIAQAFADFGIEFDIFSRTSKAIHHKTAQDFFTNLHEKGAFEERVTEQYFDPEAQQFLADRFIVGECPNCGFAEAYGDQCESCGNTLCPEDLINPKSRLSGSTPEKKLTKHWFLPLNHLSGKIRNYLQQHQDWKPNVYGQCMSWLDSGDGLQARSMTRDLDWGIKVPLKDAEGKVLYVWFDAPIGYISATKELLGEQWTDYWQKDDTKMVHFIGKDNIVFHCIIFPALLMEHGDFHLADEVPANEFLNLEGQKISTSRNWAVWLHEYLDDFPQKQDSLRYALCANAPETKDNDFTWKDFQARNNNELVAILGNFINRVLVLISKYYDGKIPAPHNFSSEDTLVLKAIETAPSQVANSLEKYRFREAQSAMMQLARTGNKYLADEEPWKKVKTDAERTATIMYVAVQVAGQLSQIMEPFLPFTAKSLQGYLSLESLSWEGLEKAEFLPAGAQVEKGSLLFEKVEDGAIEEQLAKLEVSRKANAGKTFAPSKPETSFEDFTKLDIRVGEILEAEAVPKTSKLLKLLVDLGFEKRTIVSGISNYFKPDEVIGQKVSVLINLAPRKIKGISSEGMILMAENEDGTLNFVAPLATAEIGSAIN